MMHLSIGEKKKFAEAKDLMNRVSWQLKISGIWPINTTVQSQIKFYLFVAYYTSHLSMQFADFITVFGNLEQTVANFTEVGFQTIVTFRLFILRLNKDLHRLIVETMEELSDEKYHDAEEMRIFIKYHSIVVKFWKIGTVFNISTAILWYIKPAQDYLIARMRNETAVLTNPFQIRTFFDCSSMNRIIMIYIYEFPMIYMGVLLISMMTIHAQIIMNICTQLGLCSHRVEKMSSHMSYSTKEIFSRLVRKHCQIITMAQRLDGAFDINLFYELLTFTLLLALVSYITIRNFSEAETAALFSVGVYLCYILLLLYSTCLMGECLHNEAENLKNSYYDCLWYEMSYEYRKSLMICFSAANIPLNVTAGKFYIYSLKSYVSIIKSAMTYVSVLRAMIQHT